MALAEIKKEIFTPLSKQDIILKLQEMLGDGLMPVPHRHTLRDTINTLLNSQILIWHKAEHEAPPIGKRVLVRPQGSFVQLAVLNYLNEWIDERGNFIDVVDEWAEVE